MNRKERRRKRKLANDIRDAGQPFDPEAALNEAVAHHLAGRFPEAEQIYRRILAVAPDNAGIHSNLGGALSAQGRLDDAEASYRRALAINPDYAEAHFNLGNTLGALGRLDEAEASHRRALAINPDYADAHFNLGNTLKEQGRPDDAEASYRRVLAINPDYWAAHTNLGNVLGTQGRFEEAEASHRVALESNPDNAEAHFNLGNALKEQGRTGEAEACYRSGLAIDPDHAKGHNNLGDLRHEDGRLEEAEASYRRALAVEPKYMEAHYNLGNALREQGRLDEAATSYRRAIDIAPDHVPTHGNLGLTLLMKGQLKEGWPEYEWRLRAEEAPRNYPQQRWRGEPVNGKSVLVWGEQGVGDDIMFTSMVADLIDGGARVILESDPRLVPLYRRSFPDAECIAKEPRPSAEATRGDIDFQVPSGSLARWFRPDLDSFPGGRPYLVADAAKRDELRARYRPGGDDLLVGVAWYSKNEVFGEKKSMPLIDWRPLAEVSGVRLVDLQYGDTAEERKAFEDETGAALLHDGAVDQLADLDAFAAQVAAMDLIISVSNTTVHMAGALGLPTWVLLNTLPRCCWMLERDDSPWYASVRLFRQARSGVWADVIGRAAGALETHRSEYGGGAAGTG